MTEESSQPEEQSPKVEKIVEPIGHPVPLSLFSILFLYSFGFYLIYWGYKNFRSLKCPGPSKLGSVIYALFLPLSLFQMTEKIEWKAKDFGTPVALYGYLVGITFFALEFIKKYSAVVNLSDKVQFLAFVLQVIPLVFVQSKINELCRVHCPDYKGLKPYNWIQWTILGLFGLAFFGLVLLVMFGPAKN